MDELLRDVAKTMQGFGDPTHDVRHLARVGGLAVTLAKGSEIPVDKTVVLFGALMHDLLDPKLIPDERQRQLEETRWILRLASPALGLSSAQQTHVLKIMHRVGYSKQVKEDVKLAVSPELQIVREADFLDALGAVGIARAVGYGARRGDPLYLFMDEDGGDGGRCLSVMAGDAHGQRSTVDHFHDKLFRLRDLFVTPMGLSMAKDREGFMRTYLKRLEVEICKTMDDDADGLLAVAGGVCKTQPSSDQNADPSNATAVATKVDSEEQTVKYSKSTN